MTPSLYGMHGIRMNFGVKLPKGFRFLGPQRPREPKSNYSELFK